VICATSKSCESIGQYDAFHDLSLVFIPSFIPTVAPSTCTTNGSVLYAWLLCCQTQPDLQQKSSSWLFMENISKVCGAVLTNWTMVNDEKWGSWWMIPQRRNNTATNHQLPTPKNPHHNDTHLNVYGAVIVASRWQKPPGSLDKYRHHDITTHKPSQLTQTMSPHVGQM